MSAPILRLLDLFELLPEAEKRTAAAEILRRLPEDGDLSDGALDGLADELFSVMDEEERRATSP